jgi:hypothetical protein
MIGSLFAASYRFRLRLIALRDGSRASAHSGEKDERYRKRLHEHDYTRAE